MRIGSCAVAASAAICVQAGIASAQGRTMTLAEVLARAREHAPRIASARLAVEETRGRLLGASVRLQTNPELEASVGNREGPDSRFTDFEIGLAQSFEPGSRRSERIAGANAAIAQRSANVDETTREVMRLAAVACFRALHAQERIRLLGAARELAADLYSIAGRRFKAGDIAVLDVNIARASLARVGAEREAVEALRVLAVRDLRQLVGIDDDIRVEGELAAGGEPDLTALLRAAAERPELRALEAGIQEAEADMRLGRTFARPEWGLGVRYSREEGDQILLGGVTITLPVFSRGQELQAVGSARAARLRAELDAARTRVQIEVRSAFEAYSRRVAAIAMLETDAIRGLDENEALTTRSFEAGQLGLPELLLIRREILDTRSQYLDARLEAALARIDLDASAGVLR
ncbi:MAG TPA: TolC family protein [Vicinamibacterales bacterium]|nr:TolC family protein [Vicinamibacterales bacterium]